MDCDKNNQHAATQLDKVLEHIERKVLEGLQHGHFRYEIKGSVGKNMRRELIVEAGVSDKFNIELKDLKL